MPEPPVTLTEQDLRTLNFHLLNLTAQQDNILKRLNTLENKVRDAAEAKRRADLKALATSAG